MECLKSYYVCTQDPEYMQSINWILENDIADAGLELSFSMEHQSFGRTEHVELVPGGILPCLA